MISRAALENGDKSAWELDGDDIKIDHFIKNYYDYLLPARHRRRYLTRHSLVLMRGERLMLPLARSWPGSTHEEVSQPTGICVLVKVDHIWHTSIIAMVIWICGVFCR